MQRIAIESLVDECVPRRGKLLRSVTKVLLPLVVLALSHSAQAEFEVAAPDGRRVLLKDDGTWAYQNAKEGAAAKIQPMEAVLQLEQKVERGPHCRVVMRLDNNLSYEIVQIVPSFSAYRGNGTKHETVSVGFQSIRPGDTLQRSVEFTRIACADIVRVQVSDADRCEMGELIKYSPPNGQCLARLRVAPSNLMKFEK